MRWSTLFFAAAATLGISYTSASALSGAGFIPGSSILSERDFKDYLRLTKRQEVRCGANFQGQRCPDDLCCSQFGYCGDSDIFCAEIARCQPDYGRCGDAPPPDPVETDDPDPVETEDPGTGVPPGTELTITTDGMCGNTTTCAGSGFGGCCSEFFWCGSSTDYCGTGCQSAFGDCEGSTPPDETTPPVETSPPEETADPEPTDPGMPVSTDGTCGGDQGFTCLGSASGNCCSRWGFCGDSDLNCLSIVGCQPDFGECTG